MSRRHLTALVTTMLFALAHGSQANEPTSAQPELPRERLTIISYDGKRHDFEVEMALTEEQQKVGLMFRKEIPDGAGMFFDFGQSRVRRMWMENCLVAEDMIFIGEDGRIRYIAANAAPESESIISSVVPVRATLEVAAGTAKKLDIRVGDRVLQRVFGNAS